MIKNDLQYRTAKTALKNFRSTLAEHKAMTSKEKPWVQKLHRATVLGEIHRLEADIAEYEQLKSGEQSVPKLAFINDFASLLIKKRIALGWTQKDLAKRLGVTPQQVQLDESTNYASANLARLAKIANILDKGRGKRPKNA